MKITHKKHTKKIVLTITALVVLGLAIGAYFVYASNSSQPDDQQAAEQEKAGEAIKKESLANEESKSGSSGSDQPEPPVPQPNGKSRVDVAITAANQNDNQLQIRTLISALDNQGTCTLKLQGPSGSITKTSSVQNFANSSTCQGFDVSVSELTKGNWNATVTYESTSLQGSATKEITVK